MGAFRDGEEAILGGRAGVCVCVAFHASRACIEFEIYRVKPCASEILFV